MTIKEFRDFIYENYHKQTGFTKDNSYYSMKRQKKRFTIICNQINKNIPDPSNTKAHYQSYLKKKNTKLTKQSKVIFQQPKTVENPNIVDIKSVFIEHSKTSCKLSKTEKVPQVIGVEKNSTSPLHSETTKIETFFDKKRL